MAGDKVYDATTAATITSRTLSGVISGDAVRCVGGTATFRDKNVGANKMVIATGLSLSGADSGNYTVNSTATATAQITPVTLTVLGITANNKVYDTTTNATLNTTGAALVGVFSGDMVTLNTAGATGSFTSKDVGTGISVRVAGLAISGPEAGNYALVQPTATADITIRSGPTSSLPPVTITSVSRQELRVTRHKTATVIVLQLSDTVNRDAAANIHIYSLTTLPHGRRHRTSPLALSQVRYDGLNTITLFARRPRSLNRPWQLRILAAELPDALGRPLDGDRNGQPGGDFLAISSKRRIRIA
jgi:hypothetical protein